MVVSSEWSARNDDGPLGAQTVRRVGAGPVGGLLGGKDPTGRAFSRRPSLGPAGFSHFFSLGYGATSTPPIPSSFAASARKRRSSSSLGAFLSVHSTAL